MYPYLNQIVNYSAVLTNIFKDMDWSLHIFKPLQYIYYKNEKPV